MSPFGHDYGYYSGSANGGAIPIYIRTNQVGDARH